jgi:hypothetical protein
MRDAEPVGDLAPIVSAPERAASAATTLESTPPDMATTMRLPASEPPS